MIHVRPAPRRTGLSLTESLVVVAILSLAILPVVQVLVSSSDNLKQTRPYAQAVFISEKALEDARLGASEDPHYLDLFTNGYYTFPRAPVADGAHPFFATLEDTAAPFGQMMPGQDPPIRPDTGPLYALVQPLLFTMGTVKRPGPAGQEDTLAQLALDWRDRRGKELRYQIGTPLRTWRALGQVEAAEVDASDQELGQALGGTAGLASLAAARGASEIKLGDLARLLHFGVQSQEMTLRTTREIDQLAAARTTGPARGQADALLATARLHEALAAAQLTLLQTLKTPVVSLSDALPSGSLGTPPPGYDLRFRAVQLLRACQEAFFLHLRGAIRVNQQLAQMPRLTVGMRLGAHLRLVRCLQMESLALPWPDRIALAQMLGELEAHYRGRMPYHAHFFLRERERIATLETDYPLKDAVAAFRILRQNQNRASVRLLLYGGLP